MATRRGSPFSGSPKTVPGAPQYVPGGPSRTGTRKNSRIQSGFGSFRTTVPDQSSASAWRDIHSRQIRDFQGRFAGPWGIAWQGLDLMSEGLNDYGQRVENARKDAMEALKDEMVQWMKENHPWENDTHEAEKQLRGHVVHSPQRTVIWLGHGVPYGIWLEIMQNGRFAILTPTILRFGSRVGGEVRSHV